MKQLRGMIFSAQRERRSPLRTAPLYSFTVTFIAIGSSGLSRSSLAAATILSRTLRPLLSPTKIKNCKLLSLNSLVLLLSRWPSFPLHGSAPLSLLAA